MGRPPLYSSAVASSHLSPLFAAGIAAPPGVIHHPPRYVPAPTPSVPASASWRVQQIHFAWRQRARPMHVVTLDNPPAPTHTHTHKHTSVCSRCYGTWRQAFKGCPFPTGSSSRWKTQGLVEGGGGGGGDSVEEWVRGGGRAGEGSQEVCKDSSALSHHYKRPRLYRRIPPERVFSLFFFFFFWRQLIKSPWARCLGQVFKHKGKSIPPPARLSLAGGSALISPLVAFIWRRGRILLVSASSVNGQMSRSPQWAEGIVEPLVSSVAAAPEDNRLIW